MNRKETPEHAGAVRYARAVKRLFGQHAKTCWQCRNSGNDTSRMCAEGRQMAINFYAARDNVAEIERAEKGQKGQGGLFLWTGNWK